MPRRLLALTIVLMLPVIATAQRYERYERPLPATPDAAYFRQQFSDRIKKQLDKIDWNNAQRTTAGDSILYTIPVVVHVLHQYGAELLPDTSIIHFISVINNYFSNTDPDTLLIIDKYKHIAASTQIQFKLANIDPFGAPTKGIEHIYTYLSTLDISLIDQGKVNQWPQDHYLNIWTCGALGIGYTHSSPLNATYWPYYDGIQLSYDIIDPPSNLSKPFAEDLGLPTPCNEYGSTCTDNDGIPDTPPCGSPTGFYSICGNIYDTLCDTPNVQNIMMSEYLTDSCDIMFTYGQGQFMQNVLQQDFGNRDSLSTPYNFLATGMNLQTADLPPVADMGIGNASTHSTDLYFFEGQYVYFKNASWNDTITNVLWSFSNAPLIASSTSMGTVLNKFYQPGWVTVSIAATGNNSGTSTLVRGNALYIADSTPVNALGYIQEFQPAGDMDKWPTFNYFDNSFEWRPADVGFYDNACMMYDGYDHRSFPANMTGTPTGDIDDLFTPAMDLTGIGGDRYLNFMSSGATRTTRFKDMDDSLQISYSTDYCMSWHKVSTLIKTDLDNIGATSIPYYPSSMADWVAHALPLSAAACTSHTVFRFRYYPGSDSAGVSNGNNFFLDHINFSSSPETVNMMQPENGKVLLYPNPTRTNAYLVFGNENAPALITVSDVAGKVLYQDNAPQALRTQVEIPQRIISVKGVYMVRVVCGDRTEVKKLVVY